MTHVIDNRGVRMTVDGVTGVVEQSLEYLPSGKMLLIYDEDGYLLDLSFYGEWATTDGVCVLKNGHLVWGPTFPHSFVIDNYRTFATETDGNGGTFFDYYKMHNYNDARMLFEFLSGNTNVEWSWISANFGMLQYISTSHDGKREHGGTVILNDPSAYGLYNLEKHSHNHPSGNGVPSGFDSPEPAKDIGFARLVENNYGHTVKFYIYVAATGAYTSYNSNSEYSDFHETNLEGAVVTAPKRK